MDSTYLRAAGESGLAALAIWREARGESFAAKLAVAYVILTRAFDGRFAGPNNQPDGVLAVVSQPWQFSSLTDPKDQQLTRWPKDDDAAWADCLRAWFAARLGLVPNPLPGADTYHDVSIAMPAEWKTRGVTKVGAIDRLVFYTTPR